MESETVGSRMRAIREEIGDKQPDYADRLTAAAKKLKISETYESSKVSRLETGRQPFTLEDVLIVAATDPQKRGRDWLAFGDSRVSVRESTMEKRPVPNGNATSRDAAKRGA